MKLYLKGHSYKYAVEQIMLMLFPAERPEYPESQISDSNESSAYSRLSVGKVYCTAITRLNYKSQVAIGISKINRSKIYDKLSEDRLLQKIIKLSFYKASVKITGKHPVWGALTGIRPGKIVTGLIENGVSESHAKYIMTHKYYVSDERAELCIDTARASQEVKETLKPNDIALYIGIPFCPTRCAYCSFVSHSVEKSIKLIPPFLDALFREISYTAKLIKELGLNVISVYIGGGTPTTLSAVQLEQLISHIETMLDLSSCREFTVEAGRPDTITKEKLLVLLSHGISRISINPQSMSDKVLCAIGRRHTADDIINSYRIAREIGIKNINMDLIAGLPSDSPESFRRTLDIVMDMGPENITVHTLSLKKGTRITLEGTPLPNDDEVCSMLDYASCQLRNAGYYPYYLYRQKFMSGGFENVGWSKPGYSSLYNILIMEELCSIFALGGGGSTKLVAPKIGKITRIFNAKYPHEYINGINDIISHKESIRNFYENEVF
jgi:oxygen-independent coproporphyrinogen-3 oxidase